MIEDRLKKLIEFKTVTGNNEEIRNCFDWIESQVASLPIYVKRIENNKVLSLVITTKEKNKSPKIWLAAHIDVVFADESQFIPVKKGKKLFGRGVFDMKFAVACYIELFNEIKEKLPSLDLGIMLTSDEEVGGFNGTATLIKEGYVAPIVIIPDSGTNWQFETSAKGGLWLKIQSKGISAHASRPWLGQNAIDSLINYLAELKKSPIFFDSGKHNFETPTMNIGRLSGGQATNQVVEQAEAHIDVRFDEEKDRQFIENQAIKIAQKFGNIEINTELILKGYNFNSNNPYFAEFAKIAKDKFDIKIESVKTYGSSDARFFAEKNIPVLVISPIGGGHHGTDEWIDLEDLKKYYEVLKKYVLKIAI